MAIYSSILAWEISGTEEPDGYSPWGGKEWNTTEWLSMHATVKKKRDERKLVIKRKRHKTIQEKLKKKKERKE